MNSVMRGLFLAALVVLVCSRLSAASTTVAAVFTDSRLLELSDGSVFQMGGPGDSALSLWQAGDVIESQRIDASCKGVWLTNADRKTAVCAKRANEKAISIQVVQTETAKEIVTNNSAFAVASATLVGKTPLAIASGSGSSVSSEVLKVVAEDVILSGQKVRLQCGACHALNAGDYWALLRGDKLRIVSYGMEWDKKAEKLTRYTHEEQWKIVGAWQ